MYFFAVILNFFEILCLILSIIGIFTTFYKTDLSKYRKILGNIFIFSALSIYNKNYKIPLGYTNEEIKNEKCLIICDANKIPNCSINFINEIKNDILCKTSIKPNSKNFIETFVFFIIYSILNFSSLILIYYLNKLTQNIN